MTQEPSDVVVCDLGWCLMGDCCIWADIHSITNQAEGEDGNCKGVTATIGIPTEELRDGLVVVLYAGVR